MGKNTRLRLVFSLHFFRALPLSACFTTEQSTVEASLFVNYYALNRGAVCSPDGHLLKFGEIKLEKSQVCLVPVVKKKIPKLCHLEVLGTIV